MGPSVAEVPQNEKLPLSWQVVGGAAERTPSHCECLQQRAVDTPAGLPHSQWQCAYVDFV
jgi:hypothetical protein